MLLVAAIVVFILAQSCNGSESEPEAQTATSATSSPTSKLADGVEAANDLWNSNERIIKRCIAISGYDEEETYRSMAFVLQAIEDDLMDERLDDLTAEEVEEILELVLEFTDRIACVATPTPATTPPPPSPTETPTPTAILPTTPEPPSTPAELVARVQRSVVQVKARTGGAFFALTNAGSGFIFAIEGTTAFIATNHHIIDGSDSVEIQIQDSSTYDALVLGWDAERDVAVLSICCSSNFIALPWGDASPSDGETVIAIGYPDSDTGNVVATIGEVRAPDDLSMEHDFIPHSAPLNPGNSGGPLLSMPGSEVIGINVARGTQALAFYAVPYQAIEERVEEWRSQLIVVPSPTPKSDDSTPKSDER